MMPSASSEFVALCRSQIALLTQGLGAALSIVYLAEELVDGESHRAGLIPVVVYPETILGWEKANNRALLPEATTKVNLPQLLQKATIETAPSKDEEQLSEVAQVLPSTKIVLPLLHDNVVVGLLVTGREDRPWNEQERAQIERIAQTLTFAMLLEQRREWSEQKLNQQQRLQAQQRDLLDNLLHQLRNSLTALRTFGKLLLKRLVPSDPNHSVANNLVRESDRLQDLLQQFDRMIDLTATDLEQDKSLQPPLLMEATVQPVPKSLPLLPDVGDKIQSCQVAAVMEPLLASAQAIAQERELNLKVEIPANLPPVCANPTALREVLSNIIDNALKYTPPKGEISIQVGQERNNFQGIVISDTGPGIPMTDLERIFDRHYRGSQAGSKIPGTGLGLAIVKDLIQQMQGEIEVKSPTQNSSDSALAGATFTVWLPKATQPD